MDKILLTAFLLFLAAVAAVMSGCSWSKPGLAAGGIMTASATVDSIDYTTRHVTLREDNGETTTLKVGELARNFDQLKKGDRINFEYREALAVDVEPEEAQVSEPRAALAIERAPKGEKPGGVIAGAYTTRAQVEDIDYTTRHLTVKGPNGNTATFKVGEQATRFGQLKKGDQVVIQYVEALAITVTPAK